MKLASVIPDRISYAFRSWPAFLTSFYDGTASRAEVAEKCEIGPSAPSMTTSRPSRVVICGGGVIGTSIAYYLSLRNIDTLVVERAGVANAASGKSGGFLALDWCRGQPGDALARRSFALHAELAATLAVELDLDWGYRRLDTLSVSASERRDVSTASRMRSPSWIGGRAAVHSQIGTEETTAQIHPAQFTQAMMTAAETRGATLAIGTVEGVTLSSDNRRVVGVVVNGETIDAEAVVIAMGPWSILACQWLPLPAVYGLKGHSLVFRFTPPDPRALFVELETDAGDIETPEVMPRTDGTTYVCGLSGDAPLPVDPAHVTEEDGAPERLRQMTTAFAPELSSSEILAVQACYRPVTMDSTPLLGRIPGVDGAFIATGHNVWGMLNAPGTGEAIAELIANGEATSVDLTPFNPARLKTFDASQLSD